MSFRNLMAKVVGERILSDATLRQPWDEFIAKGDTTILSSQCGNAQAIADTEQAVLYYCLTYQKSHYDAVTAAIRAGIATDVALHGRWLVIDFGAGPGTALLAWAAHVRRRTNTALSSLYVHIDSSRAMATLCKKYINADDNIAKGTTWRNKRAITATTNVADWVQDCDHAVFMFSYILCQMSVTSPIVKDFARAVANTCAALKGRPAYIIMVDTSMPRTRWPELVSHLVADGYDIGDAVTTLPLSVPTVYLRPDGSTRNQRSNDGRVVYRAVRLQ